MKHLIILISGEGSNMRAIVAAAARGQWEKRLNARVAAVISNRPGAAGLAWARVQAQGVSADCVEHTLYASRAEFDVALAETIERQVPPGGQALVLLAGFMRILTPWFVARYAGRMVNIHPSLLPAFPGLNTHQRAIDAGCAHAGATVHEVTHDLDHGPILGQVTVPILPGDTAQSLGARVLLAEHVLYPQAIEAWLLRSLLDDPVQNY